MEIGASAVSGSGEPAARIRTEWAIQMLRAGLVVLLVTVVFAQADGANWLLLAVAISVGLVFQVAFTVYVSARHRGFQIGAFETAIPFVGAVCIALFWLALDRPASYLWAFFLYTIMIHSGRLAGRSYWSFALFTIMIATGSQAYLDQRHGNGPLNANVLMILTITSSMAVVAASVAARSRAAEAEARLLARTDPLTGISNRRDFLSGLDDSGWGVAMDSVLMLDIDDFKRINDERGHLQGDQILVEAALILREFARPGDRIARFGGEEFVAFLPGTDFATAHALAEQVRRAVRLRTPATITIGCATRRHGEDSLAVLHRADELLLKAKRSGKDQTLGDGGPQLATKPMAA